MCDNAVLGVCRHAGRVPSETSIIAMPEKVARLRVLKALSEKLTLEGSFAKTECARRDPAPDRPHLGPINGPYLVRCEPRVWHYRNVHGLQAMGALPILRRLQFGREGAPGRRTIVPR
jgi:hypothetical protein